MALDPEKSIPIFEDAIWKSSKRDEAHREAGQRVGHSVSGLPSPYVG